MQPAGQLQQQPHEPQPPQEQQQPLASAQSRQPSQPLNQGFNLQYKLQDAGTATPPPSSSSKKRPQSQRYASFACPPDQVRPETVQYQEQQLRNPSQAPNEQQPQQWIPPRSTSPQDKLVAKHEVEAARETTTPVEQFAPNLQFRKVWDDHHGSRQRNPSLLCDPLASAPAAPAAAMGTSVTPPIGGLANTRGISPSSSVGNRLSIQRSISSNTTNSRHSVTLPPPSSIHRPSSLLANASFSSQSTILNSPRARNESSASTITPIVAPIPHRNSVASGTGEPPLSSSVGASVGATLPHPLSTGPEGTAPSYSLPLTPIGNVRSASENHSGSESQPQFQARSLPGSASGGSSNARMGPPPTKIPSISSSLQDRLRPSVFELHAISKGSTSGGGGGSLSAAAATGTNSAPGSISASGFGGGTGNSGSIGSHSTVLIFSNKSSSISSTQSSFSYPFQRTSSFGGSISFGTKSSISIAPHEVVDESSKVRPTTPQSPGHIDPSNPEASAVGMTATKLEEEQGGDSIGGANTLASSARLKNPLQQLVLRPTTPVFGYGTAHNPRSSSPLSKVSHHHHDASGGITKPQLNKKVSVTSLLDDSSTNNAKAFPKLSQAVTHAIARSRSTSPTTVRSLPSSHLHTDTNTTTNSAMANTAPPPNATNFESKQPLYMSSLIREEKNSHSSSSSSGEEINSTQVITE